VRKGKLESRVVKVKILRWWSDETKGYRLEDLENNKLITLYNVWFFKDKTPSNLAVVEVNIKYPSTNDINRLVDNTINSNQDTATSITSRQSSDNIIPIAANDTLTYHTLLLLPHLSPEPDLLPLPSSVKFSKQPLTISKPSKWANLPKRDLSNHIKKPVDQYCYDLAKQLSHYLYFFSFFFFFFFFLFGLTTQERSTEKCYITNITYYSHMSGCYSVMSHDEVT